MLQVSDAARAALEGMQPDRQAADADVLRLEVRDGVPAVRWDTGRGDDHLLRQRRRPLLVVAAPLAESLGGMILDHGPPAGAATGPGAFSLRPGRP